MNTWILRHVELIAVCLMALVMVAGTCHVMRASTVWERHNETAVELGANE